jgi:hypothetical protein
MEEMSMSHKVYLMLGFHVSFYHSWRGDSPDEAGFGTDIRVVREILKMLDRADRQGWPVRGYWDFDVYWNMAIIPRHAPDILDGIRQRVQAGPDEIIPMPFNNGANHAATEDEFRAAVAYAFENPYGSGLRQVFGRAAPFFRPQESMYTTGQNAILLENGVTGVLLAYSAAPYNALSTFIPTLTLEQRYNPLWFHTHPGERPIVLLPWISTSDLVENVSLESLLLKLHDLQTSGEIQSDVVIHFNQDADSEAWLPVKIPRAFAWFPNTGGLEEYIRVVNRYPWAEFTTPSEYLKSHPPRAEVLVRQDLADGGFDGSYSWAEKYGSLKAWTMLERSRLHSYRAMALAREAPAPLAGKVERRLWIGLDSSFFKRLAGLSTTHFGMSTPIINEERQAKAEALLGSAQQIAASAEAEVAQAVRQVHGPDGGALYVFEVFNFPRGRAAAAQPVRSIVRLPVVLPTGVTAVSGEDAAGQEVQASLVNVRPLPDGRLAAEVMFVAELGAEEHRIYHLRAASPDPGAAQPNLRSASRLQNRWLELSLSESSGITSLRFLDQIVGDDQFLRPFISYRTGKKPIPWAADRYEFVDLPGETWHGLARARLTTRITFQKANVAYTSLLSHTFTLFDSLPILLVDVEAQYASTPATDVIQALQQKLRRLVDLGWVEVAPFQLNPAITAPAARPLRVWKHNYLGITSAYDLDYGTINPKNRDLEGFNHQVTAGWVAISNRTLGLLLAENAEVLASMAFCPMRLRQVDGVQHLSLNPFGSYFGRQLSYEHLGGNGIGAALTCAISGSLRPNGPSYNGQTVRFSLLLAPYAGDEPPQQLQEDAMAHFYPPGIVYSQTPAGLDAVMPEDLRTWIKVAEREAKLATPDPLPTPAAFLANPADQAVDLVWEAVRDPRLTGYELRWREAQGAGWQAGPLPPAVRHRVAGLENGRTYTFQLRAIAPDRHSAWTHEASCIPGPVTTTSLTSALPGLNPWLMVKLVAYSVASALRSRLRRASAAK